MHDFSFVVLGTDTDAGKTTFSLLWLSFAGERYAYWKPLQTGDADSTRVRDLVPGATLFPSLCSFDEPVAPLLAARRAGAALPSLDEMLARTPAPADGLHLLIESFGGPFSPLVDGVLQVDWIRRLELPVVLVDASRLGAVGRSLACLRALASEGLRPAALVLVGPADPFAIEQLSARQPIPVFALAPPRDWTEAGVRAAAQAQTSVLSAMGRRIQDVAAVRDAATAAVPAAAPVRGSSEHAWRARDARAVWHPYTPLRSPPSLVCVGACGEFLELDQGGRLIDGIASWWTILHAHRDPGLVCAMREASERIDHVLFAGVTHPWGIELAELLLDSANMTDGRAFYSDNGSTAVEVALKMAYQHWCLRGQPERTRFVGFEHGYHGDTFGAMAVSRDPVFFGRFEPLLFAADILPLDARRLDEHLSRCKGSTAAVIVEPLVQGAGGMRMHAPGLLADLFETARKHGVLLIADEVMTGGGRTGKLWAFQQAGIAPDLICAAKTLAGGMLPLAATLVSAAVAAPFDNAERGAAFFHGHSFTGHPLACAVALANWRSTRQALSEKRLVARHADFWQEQRERFERLPRVRQFRTLGAIAAVELDLPGGYLAQAARAMADEALRHGVFLRPLGNVLYALPPLCASNDSLNRLAEAMRAAVRLVEP